MQPVVIDKDNVIVIGHCRVLGAERLGMKEVPCVCVDELTPEQVKALRIVDNKTNESEWDIDYLKDELEEIDLSDFEFDFEVDLGQEPEEKEIIEDEPPEPDEENEPVAQFGQIWQLGRHRLMCGDSTNSEMVAELMNENQADLVVTDPPYNVDYTGKTKDALKIQNDRMNNDEFYNFLCKAFNCANESMRPGAAFYIWYASREVVNFQNAIEQAGLTVKQELIWNKNVLVMGRQDYQWKHEPCLYGWKEGASHYFIDDRTQTTVFEDKGLDFKKMKKEELVALLKDIYSDKISTTIINEDKPARSSLHPTMKPIKLIARQVRNSSKPGEIVLDLFGGSGSTLITCEQTGRTCYTMEYDPKYVDVIIQRYENFTGEKAVLLNE